MKINILFLCICCLVSGLCFAAEEEWLTVKSTHFVVFYKKAPEDFVKKVSDQAEKFYDKITSDLGFNRFDFWLWDNRAKIYIYDDADQFQAAIGNSLWVEGIAVPRTKTIRAFYQSKGFNYAIPSLSPDFLSKVLPHEIAHIIFREFVGFSNKAIPLWLEEGLAVYEEKAKYAKLYPMFKLWHNQNIFMPLERLSQLDMHSTPDTRTVEIFYAEAFSVVDFLMREFGKEKFVLFCQNLRDKNNFEQALVSTYSFRNIGELDSAWQKYLWHE